MKLIYGVVGVCSTSLWWGNHCLIVIAKLAWFLKYFISSALRRKMNIIICSNYLIFPKIFLDLKRMRIGWRKLLKKQMCNVQIYYKKWLNWIPKEELMWMMLCFINFFIHFELLVFAFFFFLCYVFIIIL